MREDLIILSGGAEGADEFFGNLGYLTYAFSFEGHKGNVPKRGHLVKLSQERLDERFAEYEDICIWLGRRVAKDKYVRNLMLRNMFQIENKFCTTELVIAIGSIDRDMNHVEGGTGYAVEKAIMTKRPDGSNIPIVVVYKRDEDVDFFIYDYDTFKFRYLEKRDEIDISNMKYITGIGTRNVRGILSYKYVESAFREGKISNFINVKV